MINESSRTYLPLLVWFSTHARIEEKYYNSRTYIIYFLYWKRLFTIQYSVKNSHYSTRTYFFQIRWRNTKTRYDIYFSIEFGNNFITTMISHDHSTSTIYNSLPTNLLWYSLLKYVKLWFLKFTLFCGFACGIYRPASFLQYSVSPLAQLGNL